MTAPTLVPPAFGRGCITDLMSALLHPDARSPLPADFGAGPRVLLVLDGLGWDQLQDHKDVLPTVSTFVGGPITTVAPSTTAAALTSITTALPPGEHGLVGYRMVVDDAVFNTLRWGTDARPDCRRTIPPPMLQPYDPFLGSRLALVTKAEFRRSGFTEAHLRGGTLTGYRTTAVLVHEVARLVREGEQAVYAYYDGVDKVAHEYGLASEYRAELGFVDRLVKDLMDALPSGTTLMVTADHGQVDCGHDLLPIAPDVLSRTDGLSGEARFRWLHAPDGGVGELLDAATDNHSHHAWVRSTEQMLDEQWFGRNVSDEVRSRLGDVALLPFLPIGFEDPDDGGPMDLIGRHGSLTSAEMYVPCVTATA
ncbi:MAG: alkaline phosphatase family protein [Actinomycetota bacterium]